MQKLFLGTRNEAKINHYKRFLSDWPVEILTPKDLSIDSEPVEDGATLEENAKIKAEFYWQKSHLPTIADDAGFEIAALDNFPGTHSRRFLGHKMTDDEIFSQIIKKMNHLAGNDRKAKMSIAVALAKGSDEMYIEKGYISGYVPERPYDKLEGSFPYRSLLYITELNKWFYDITEEEEDRLGYRKAAVEKLKKYLFD